MNCRLIIWRKGEERMAMREYDELRWPRADVPVAPGAHRLRVVRDGFRPYELAIQVAAGQELRITDIVLQEIKP